jgi:hypothetical protein
VYPEGKPVVFPVNVPAMVPGCSVVVAVAVPGRVKAVVVSTFVPVIVELVIGGFVSPGALIVEVTPSAEPSCTVSYCFWSRCILLRPHETAANTSRMYADFFGLIGRRGRT